MIKTLPITKARDTLPKIVDKAASRLDEFVITVNGVPKAVIISSAEYESWQETVEILADSELMKGIKEGEEDFKKGDFITFEQLKNELRGHVQTSNFQKSLKQA